jgi:hypothetical protein
MEEDFKEYMGRGARVKEAGSVEGDEWSCAELERGWRA